jgi:hypothetical protein
VGAKHPSGIAAYTHEVEFALLAACLRTPLAVDEAGLVIDDKDFLEPACARLWLLMINARIECAEVDDDRLREALAGMDEADAERIIHRLRHPLVKPKSITKFARDLKRLARERAA